MTRASCRGKNVQATSKVPSCLVEKALAIISAFRQSLAVSVVGICRILPRSPPQPERCVASTSIHILALCPASAHTRMPCLVRPKTLRCKPLQCPNQASKSHWSTSFGLLANRLHQTQPVRDPSSPTRADSKYIGFPVGGFLQTAVSEAPPRKMQTRAVSRGLQKQH